MPLLPELPPISHAPLSIVLTARNNEAAIEQTLRGWVGVLGNKSLKRDYEIILVDDASTDRTVALARAVAGRHEQIRLLEHAVARGVGAALRTGIAAARHPLLLYSTADKRYAPENLVRYLRSGDRGRNAVNETGLWQRIKWWFAGYERVNDPHDAKKAPIDSAHVVSGYRMWKAQRRRKRWNEVVYGWLVREIFGVRLRDVDCEFKLFRREIFSRIPIQSDGPFVHTEILAKANFLGKLIAEDIPIEYRQDALQADNETGYWGRWRAAWQLFSHPDFGPANLAEENMAISFPR